MLRSKSFFHFQLYPGGVWKLEMRAAAGIPLEHLEKMRVSLAGAPAWLGGKRVKRENEMV
ncbi:MAG TPA: hypothetical protein PLG17_07565 [Thermodesulfobacteriota bacterium]|nr:hypothetical protein [Thermodesulfobacteriota bacterium]HNU72060.1 hypothetical protein [Thermodesulfobacteriota bacterium]HOC38822.1 hypothetical protein [Thermodesulfobacteriota bacterium]HQO78355.1 hypothetical protein [Thermodesulfobacteriota bacterium]